MGLEKCFDARIGEIMHQIFSREEVAQDPVKESVHEADIFTRMAQVEIIQLPKRKPQPLLSDRYKQTHHE